MANSGARHVLPALPLSLAMKIGMSG